MRNPKSASSLLQGGLVGACVIVQRNLGFPWSASAYLISSIPKSRSDTRSRWMPNTRCHMPSLNSKFRNLPGP